MSVPKELLFTPDHEWVRVSGATGRIGITDFAQDQLGDVVFVELPEKGSFLRKGEPFGVVESVKSVSDLYAPVTGTVTGVNTALSDAPEKVNEDPFGAGWMVEVSLSAMEELTELLDAEDYESHLGAES